MENIIETTVKPHQNTRFINSVEDEIYLCCVRCHKVYKLTIECTRPSKCQDCSELEIIEEKNKLTGKK